MKRIPLVTNTIPNEEIDQLIDWLKTYPKLTKGELTVQFEKAWSRWIGADYSIFVNSGSSANLLLMAALLESQKLKIGDYVVVPAVSWATTVSPVMQLGYTPILCDSSVDNLGIDTYHFEKLCKKYRPTAVVLCHVLGFPCDMTRIIKICNEYNVLIIEDSCETVGSLYRGRKVGNPFGIASTFSTYYGHHFSTIEGGLISTNDFDLYQTLLCLRSHGWSRDMSVSDQKYLQAKYGVDDFRNQYTFYHPGYNLRATDLQAFLGLNQLKTLSENCHKRYMNLLEYDRCLKNPYWKIKTETFDYVSNFAYPVITPYIEDAVAVLESANIDSRPLVCGNIGRQPFWLDEYGPSEDTPNADRVHDWGFYVPNNPSMTNEDIQRICNVLNPVLQG